MPFHYEPTFQLHEDTTVYRKLTGDHVSAITLNGAAYLQISPLALTRLAKEALNDISFYLRPAHLARLREELADPEASDWPAP